MWTPRNSDCTYSRYYVQCINVTLNSKNFMVGKMEQLETCKDTCMCVSYKYTVYCIVCPTLDTVLEIKMGIHKAAVLVVKEDPVVMKKVSPTAMRLYTAWTCGEEGVSSFRYVAGGNGLVHCLFLTCSQVRNADL